MSANALPYRHISESVDEALDIIDKRRLGEIKSLSTGKDKLDKYTLNGLEWNRIMTIGGLSGSGKSLTLEELKYNLIEKNDEEFDVLSFEFEMLSTDQVTRRISSKVKKSTKYLYSAEENTISQDEFNAVKNVGNKLKDYPIYYVDSSGTVPQIMQTILNFANAQQLKEKISAGALQISSHLREY